ncbi:hypothetical protein ACRAWF_39990 [Streptomyces sp. L7]
MPGPSTPGARTPTTAPPTTATRRAIRLLEWNSDSDRSTVKPGLDTFCDPDINACDPADPPRCEVDHLGETCDPPHWYHAAQTTWKVGCAESCGHEYLTYKTLRVELGNGNNGAGTRCDNSDVGFTIVDDVPSSVPTFTDGCDKSGWTDSGSFSFRFNADARGHYEAKGDLHQIGGGFGDHFWYAHARDDSHGASAHIDDPATDPGTASGVMAATGTWQLSSQRTSWTRVLVHLPDTGSASQQAVYTIHPGDGTTHNRIINAVSHENRWVSLGIYHFTAGSDFQGVTLSNYTAEGQADNDIAWDAVGFQWLSAKPQHIVASLGDSYSSGEGAGDYDESTDQEHGTVDWNACSRSANAWPRKLVLPGMPAGLATLSDNYSPNAELGFVACSGSTTWNVDGTADTSYWQSGEVGAAEGEFREIPQIQSGVLTKDTTLVTVTMGGNNYGTFVGAISDCATLGDCANSDYLAKYEALADKIKEDVRQHSGGHRPTGPQRQDPDGRLPGDPQPHGQVHRLLVHRRRREPTPWPPWRTTSTASRRTRSTNCVRAASTCRTPIRSTRSSGTAAATATSGSTRSFSGRTATATSTRATRTPRASRSPGSAETCLSREAFHPNSAGTTGYEHVVEDALSAIGYTGT